MEICCKDLFIYGGLSGNVSNSAAPYNLPHQISRIKNTTVLLYR